jgi:hypothetical protein
LLVGLAVWFLAGLRGRQDDLKLTTRILERFGVKGRSAKYKALKALEGAGLIRVLRRHGKNPLLTILDVGDAKAAA